MRATTVMVTLLASSAGIALAQAPAVAPPPTPPPSAAVEEPQAEWPRAIDVEGGSIEIYQPQIEKFEGTRLAARSAIAWTEKGKEPVFGVVWLDTRVLIDKDTRLVDVEEVKIRKIRFPNITPEQERRFSAFLEAEIPKWDMHISLDAVQASLAVTQREVRSSDGLKSAPPRMLFSSEPAVLLLYDGKPVERPLEKTGLTRVVNTPMLVILDPQTKRFYLSGGRFWYEATAATGPFSPVAAPSPAVKAFYDANPPPPERKEGDAGQQAEEQAYEDPRSPPRILVATQPTELFVFDGPPQYRPVGGDADLLYAENTQSHVLVFVPANETYVLASGRWFKARSLDGPWTAVRPDKLPAAFASLPPDSGAGDVRTFVSGTEEADNALADTQIPQTTAVRRDQEFEVHYDGQPRFKAIEGTPLAFAVNTGESVIRDAGRYWACSQGVWYVALTPNGPWRVSDRRPPDIDQVPPSAPVYNTKYVYVYQSTPQVVYVGYLPGYTGVYPYYGTVVYGTGFYYPPYIGPSVYYPRPCTYGYRVSYNPWIGFGVTVGYGTPFISVGMHFGPSYYPPYYRAGWWGPVGYRPYPPPYPGGWYRPPPGYRPPYPGYRPPPPGYGGGYRPPPGGPGYRPPPPGGAGYRPPPGGTIPAPPRTQANNLYARPENATRNVDRATAASSRPAPKPVNRPNNVYADKQGNVYRQNQAGSWDRNTREGWRPQQGASGGAKPPQQRPASGQASPATRPTTSPGARSGASAQPAYRPSPQPAARPSPQPSARPQPTSPASMNRGGGAPAGLGRDAAARQRAPPTSRPAAPHGGGSRGGGGGGGGGGHRGR